MFQMMQMMMMMQQNPQMMQMMQMMQQNPQMMQMMQMMMQQNPQMSQNPLMMNAMQKQFPQMPQQQNFQQQNNTGENYKSPLLAKASEDGSVTQLGQVNNGPNEIAVIFQTGQGPKYNLSINKNAKIRELINKFLVNLNIYIPEDQLSNFKMLFTYNAKNLTKLFDTTVQGLGITNNATINVIDYNNLIGGD